MFTSSKMLPLFNICAICSTNHDANGSADSKPNICSHKSTHHAVSVANSCTNPHSNQFPHKQGPHDKIPHDENTDSCICTAHCLANKSGNIMANYCSISAHSSAHSSTIYTSRSGPSNVCTHHGTGHMSVWVPARVQRMRFWCTPHKDHSRTERRISHHARPGHISRCSGRSHHIGYLGVQHRVRRQ